MSQPLAKVTGDLDGPRGADVLMTISVQRSWFGKAVEIELPRVLNCARCEGGGCDLCERSGAIALRERDAEPCSIRVVLPDLPHPEADLQLRIPSTGGCATAPELNSGHLLLTVQPGATSGLGVQLAGPSFATTPAEQRAALIRSSLLMAGGLIVLFFLLLRLSGWL